MRNLLTLTALLLIHFELYAQRKVAFLDKNYNETKERKATYFMEETENEDTIYKDIYIKYSKTGIVVTKIKFSKNSPEYIYQKENYRSGKPKNEGWFLNKKKTGVWIYYSDWGFVGVSKTYENNKEKGLRKDYYINGNLWSEYFYINGLKNGNFKTYYSNGILSSEGSMINSSRDGLVVYYDEFGNIESKTNYKKDKIEGNDSVYISGKLFNVVNYVNGVKEGPYHYFEDGKIIESGFYKKDTIFTSTKFSNSHKKDTVNAATRFFSEVMPEYPGGEKAMMKFISNNIKYPEDALAEGVEGTVRLKFTVAKDGSIENINIISNPLFYGCDKAAYDVIASMPKWKPGMQDGKPVPVYFNIPIRFRLF